jgi:2-succinyl-6-hydroxy-2,4-cyclohexadiene-1-carboxylate synthase
MSPVLLLLHGFAGSPHSFDAVVAALGRPESVEVLAPALSGHLGGPAAADFDQELARLSALLPAGRRSVVCGYSLGGRLALGLLQRAPEQFRAAVLIGVNPGLESAAERQTRRLEDERWAALLESEGTAAFVEAWSKQPLFASQSGLGPEQLERQQRIRESHEPKALAQALRGLGLAAMPNYWPLLERISLPVQLIAGEADPKFSALGRRMQRALPRAHLRIVPGAGHNVVLERPDAIGEALSVACDGE